MDKNKGKPARPPAPATRKDRLKQALKENLKKRKQQAKARSGQDSHGD